MSFQVLAKALYLSSRFLGHLRWENHQKEELQVYHVKKYRDPYKGSLIKVWRPLFTWNLVHSVHKHVIQATTKEIKGAVMVAMEKYGLEE